MPQFGARVEYAVHTLLNLSLAPPDAEPSARDLADFQKLPRAFMRKLLSQLERAGVIVSAEGVHGGWQLARPADRITILEIVDAAQGPDPLFECREIRARCALWPDEDAPRAARSGTCEIHGLMLRAERAMRAELAAQTLADLRVRVGTKAPRFTDKDVPSWFAGRVAERRAGAGRGAAKTRLW